jgi:aryl-alcohol dehydrogenase-like predicted oxidoreductase
MIAAKPFGRSGHRSTRALFGSVCLKWLSQSEADPVLDLLLKYGINHIDTAPMYGDAELRLGPWMKEYRREFFLATKIDSVSYQQAKEQFQRSLERLQVESVDLLQLHNLTDVARRELIMKPGGALDFLIEARERGLTRFLGITGHGLEAPKLHLQSLERFAFDAVLLPCNFLLMQNPVYAAAFRQLLTVCWERNIAVQTIKSIARGLWAAKERTHVTWYEPLSDPEAIRRSVHWVMAQGNLFLNTVGDIQELPKFLEAVAFYDGPPSDEQMLRVVHEQEMQPLFV